MALENVDGWFTEFRVDAADRPESDIVWTDALPAHEPVRKPTRAERLSVLLIGVFAIGFIVLMAITLIVAVYISRH